MTTTTKRLIALSDEDLAQLADVVGGSGSVELKVTVPESDHRSTVRSLGIDPLEAQIRQVFFFDTPQLELNRAGVVVRARRVQGRADDSVVKLRPVQPGQLPDHLRQSPMMAVEVDAMPGGWICSAALKGTLGRTDVRQASLGKRSIRKLFSKEQRAFYAAHAPEGLGMDDLTMLGPIFVLKLNFRPAEYPGKLVAEMWFYPDGSRILELSTKCSPSGMWQTVVDARLFLNRHGVDITGEQQTKTKTALNYFTRIAREHEQAAEPEK